MIKSRSKCQHQCINTERSVEGAERTYQLVARHVEVRQVGPFAEFIKQKVFRYGLVAIVGIVVCATTQWAADANRPIGMLSLWVCVYSCLVCGSVSTRVGILHLHGILVDLLQSFTICCQ